MLSTTNTINDIKTKLRKDYAYFGFATDNSFIAALTDCVDTVKYNEMIPFLGKDSLQVISQNLMDNGIYSGESYYNSIATKDKIGLTLEEQYIYKAEIWFSCSEFINTKSTEDKYKTSGSGYSISLPDYSESVSGGIGETKNSIASTYYNNAVISLQSAGINTSSLFRGGR